MISASDLNDKILAALDAEGSDRYDFDRDIVHAINYSIDWMVSVFNMAFGANKLSEENLRELVKIRIWQTSQHSRIYIDEDSVTGLCHGVWTVLGVFPEPVTVPNLPASALPTVFESKLVQGYRYVSSQFSAKRLTLEEWNINTNNPFLAGSTVFSSTSSLRSYAYLNYMDYQGSQCSDGNIEIEIKPYLVNKYVAIAYLKRPDYVTVIQNDVEFPSVLTNMIVDAALRWIAFKQGDSTNLWQISDSEVNRLTQLMG